MLCLNFSRLRISRVRLSYKSNRKSNCEKQLWKATVKVTVKSNCESDRKTQLQRCSVSTRPRSAVWGGRLKSPFVAIRFRPFRQCAVRWFPVTLSDRWTNSECAALENRGEPADEVERSIQDLYKFKSFFKFFNLEVSTFQVWKFQAERLAWSNARIERLNWTAKMVYLQEVTSDSQVRISNRLIVRLFKFDCGLELVY